MTSLEISDVYFVFFYINSQYLFKFSQYLVTASSLGCIIAFWCLPCLFLHSHLIYMVFMLCFYCHFTAPHLRVSVPWSHICICIFVSHQLHLHQLGPTCCHYNACCVHCYILCLSHISPAWRWWIPNVNLSAGSYRLHHAISSMDPLGLHFLSHAVDFSPNAHPPDIVDFTGFQLIWIDFHYF